MSKHHSYRFKRVHTPSIKLHGDVIAITITGLNTKNQPMSVSFEAEWYWLVNVLRSVQKLWKTVLSRRQQVNREISEVLGG